MGRTKSFERGEGRQDFLVRGGNQQAVGAAGVDPLAIALPFDVDPDTRMRQRRAREQTIESRRQIRGPRFGTPDSEEQDHHDDRRGDSHRDRIAF